MSDADELIKLKELLDKGIITQEEFEMRKSKILEKTSHFAEKDKKQNKDIKNKKNSDTGWWIVFIIFAMATLGNLSQGIGISFIMYFITCLVCMPTFISWLDKKLNITISQKTRIVLIIILLMIAGITLSVPKNNNVISETTSNISINTNENQQNMVFVQNTNGKDFFENVLCANTQTPYKEPETLKADNYVPFDTKIYSSNDLSKYSFDVTTNMNDEIANIQMYFFNYGKEDPTNYFMAATRLDYPTKDVAQLTNFITQNIGKDERIKIGDFTFHLYKGTSDNCIIFDIYTEEFAKLNGNP